MGEKEEAAERGAQQNAFIGRTRELSELRAALEQSLAGRGGCFLISGEPGIGKTRLADELAADAASRGVRVAWGRCWEGGGAPAYWPWVEIVRALVLEPGRARPQQTAVPPEIGQLIPELAAETTQHQSSSDPEQGRFRLFDAVATLVKQVARSTPVALILDDLHEADRGSLELLKFVARGLTDSRVVIVGTYRDAEVRRSTYLAESISEVVRHGHPMPLAGLAENEVAQMVEHRAERSPSATFASELHRVTAGNPLFVDGVIRVLLAERKLGMAEHLDLSGFKLPEGVRGAIRKRLALLSAEAQSALAVAAVIGQEFDVVLLERVSQESAGTLAELMREAAEVGIVAATSRESYRFTHPLIREALYRDSTDAERGRRHLMVADVLEEMHAANLRPHLAALAHHFREAAIVEKAIDYSIRAGEASYAVFAYEEAALHWEATLELMATRVGGDLTRRAGVLWRLGDEFVSTGPRAIGYLEAAALLYEQLDNQEMTGEVHSRLGHYFSAPDLGATDMSRSTFHFQKAETLLANQPESFAYADLCAEKSSACVWARRTSEGLSSARRAMGIAERIGNGSVWVHGAIVSSLFLILTGSVAEGVELANQARRRAESINQTRPGSDVAWVGGGNHLNLRDPREAQLWFSSELARPRTAQSARRRPVLLGLMVVACAWTGELAEAHRYLAELGARNFPDLLHCDGEWEEEEKTLSRWCMRAHVKGNIYDESLHLRDLGESYRVRCDYAQAARCLRQGLAIGTEAGDVLYELSARSILALVLADAGQAHEARPEIERCREILGAGEDWRGLAGYVARAEAVGAAAEGRFDDANAQFEKAIATFKRYELPWEEAETFLYWGRAANAAGHSGASEEFDAAIEIYRRHGTGQRWIDRVEAERARIELPDTAAPLLDQRPSNDECLFRREGEFWTVGYGGLTCRLKDMKGLGYIAHLIAHPGHRIHVLDLFAQVGGSAAATAPSVDLQAEDLEVISDLGDATEVLDSRARAEYRQRLSELHAELEEAERNNDIGCAERTRNELDSLTDGLRSALGLGGRSRRFTAETERARGTVSKSIRVSLDRIQRSHRELGDHLSTCIRTGYFCAYLPDPGRQPSWRI